MTNQIQFRRENDKMHINSAILRKNSYAKTIKRAEDSILNGISYKMYRSEEQSLGRRGKRKQSRIKITPKKSS